VVLLMLAAGAVGAWAATRHSRDSAATAQRTITITDTRCGAGWKPSSSSTQSFVIVNKTGKTGEVYLIDDTGGVIGEIEGLGPDVQRTMTVALPNGSYKWLCIMTDQPVLASDLKQVTGSTARLADPAVQPASEEELAAPLAAYHAYVVPKLAALSTQVAALRTAVAANNVTAARSAWLAAQLTWEQVGAAYGSFEDLGDAIDGLPDGLPDGVNDPDFTGLHRIEYGLWHNQTAATLLPIVDALRADVTELTGKLPEVTIDPNDLALRAHEILEDALRDHLTGNTDHGSGASLAETYADLQGTRVVLDELKPLLDKRRPDLMPAVQAQMDALDAALLANHSASGWLNLSGTPLANRQRVNAALGELLETLSVVPDLLEIRSAAQPTK
jgi:high-affinity iron transporter